MKKNGGIVIFVFLFFAGALGLAQKEVYVNLEEARKAISDGNYARSWELYEQLENSRDTMPFPVQEMILWEAADLCSRRGRNAVSADEKFYFYNKAVSKWGSYLDWIVELASPQQTELKNAGINRIGTAIHNLAIAFVDRGNRITESAPNDGICEMFSKLNQYQAEFFIPATLDWWKIWLMKYSNDWKGTSGKSYKSFVRQCFQNEHDCFELWMDYKEFLKEIVLTNQNLNPAQKKRLQVEIDFIESLK